MKAICPNNRNHERFTTTAHVVQDWEVDSNGNFIKSVNDCVEVTSDPNIDNVWECAICGAQAILTGEVRTLYATVLEGQEESYCDVYNSEAEALAQIGEYVDGLKVVSVKKGYSLAPKGQEVLYDEAPDFCESFDEIFDIARELDIVL